eukprot:927749-Amphidinium_carterae.1
MASSRPSLWMPRWPRETIGKFLYIAVDRARKLLPISSARRAALFNIDRILHRLSLPPRCLPPLRVNVRFPQSVRGALREALARAAASYRTRFVSEYVRCNTRVTTAILSRWSTHIDAAN